MNLVASDYIPQKSPMVFVDHIIEVGDHFSVAELVITPQLMFTDAHGLPTWSSIELMAQTIAVFAGLQGKAAGRAPQIGYLLGTRKLALPMAYFEMGKTVSIRAEQQYLHEGLAQFLCEISYEEHRISAVLSVYEPTSA